MIGAPKMSQNKKTYCPLPFIAVDVLDKKFSPCAYIEKKIFKKYETIEDYYDSTELKNLQNNLSNGIKDTMCSTCWKNEDIGIQSMRQSVLQDRYMIEKNKISQIKLHTGNRCNLSCMMCFPSVSTSWNKLWSKKNYPELFYKESGFENYDFYAEEYIKKNIDNILFIETLGGEPLFSKHFISLLNWIIKEKKSKNITLYIITNLTLLPKSLIKILSCFKKIVLTISLEGIGAVNDYIRWGSKFEIIDKNIKIAQSKGFNLSIVATANSLNLHRLQEIYVYAESLKIPVMQVSVVKGWPSLDPTNLPKYLHNKVDIKFKKFLLTNADDNSLKKFIINWDRQRNIDILDFMPEFEEFMQ
jgi:sulfatase maturation enzyme AslB (radical SAM superfamily)